MAAINKAPPSRFGRIGIPPQEYQQSWASDMVRTLDSNFSNIQNNVNNIATTDALGVVQVGNGLDVTKFGVLSVSPSYGATGYYGSFYDTTIQNIVSTTAEYPVNINTTAESNGVSIVSSNRITVANAGTYNFQFSLQMANSDSQLQDASVWLKLNGNNVANSAGLVNVVNRHGSIDGHIIVGWNYVLTLDAGSYLQLFWRATSTTVSLTTVPASTLPTIPVAPSVIATIQQITKVQTSTLGFATVPGNYANDAAAAVGGVAIGGVYRNGSVLQVRVT